jgi:C1A family cysteine protease
VDALAARTRRRSDRATQGGDMTKLRPRTAGWYGWLPDLPDHRDYRFAAIRLKRARLPRKVDLRALCSPVENQGDLGSCTANALVGALEFLEKKQGRAVRNLSRLFVYYNERALEGTVGEDSGAFLRDGIKTLVKLGVCEETLWPYVIARYRKKPTAACFRAATKHQLLTYHRLDTIADMRSCLADGYPFVFGFTVFTAFESAKVEKTGVLNMPGRNEEDLGGHAVLAVGFDDAAKRLIVRNSWGADWGMRGYFTMPYAYVSSRDLADDFWTVRAFE